jgi:hypothetical protein
MANIYPINGAAEWNDDIVYEGEGTKTGYLYWATGDWLLRKPIPGATDWSREKDVELLSDALNDDRGTIIEWHTMKVVGGALMICNGRYLAMVGYDTSFTAQAMTVYPDELTKSIIERQNLVIIGTYKDNDSKKGALYSWNQEALNFIQRKEIPSGAINGLVEAELTLMQAGEDGGIFYSDLINSIAITSIPGGGKVNPDAVETDDGLALFGIAPNILLWVSPSPSPET